VKCSFGDARKLYLTPTLGRRGLLGSAARR
jgi:hypothetical protein